MPPEASFVPKQGAFAFINFAETSDYMDQRYPAGLVYVSMVDTAKKTAECYWLEKTWNTVLWPTKKDTVTYDKYWDNTKWEATWRKKNNKGPKDKPPQSQYKLHWSSQDQPFGNFVPYHIPEGQVRLCPQGCNLWTCERVKLSVAFMDKVAKDVFEKLGCINTRKI